MKFNGVVFPISIPRITLPFRGYETKWYSPEKPHKGVDIAPFPGSTGEPIFAPCRGKVVEVGFHEYAGNEIYMRTSVPYAFGVRDLELRYHQVEAGEDFYLRFAHNESNLVREKTIVHTGQIIGYVGSTGKFTTGPHVHMEVKIQGKNHHEAMVVDPMDFFIASIVGLRNVLI